LPNNKLSNQLPAVGLPFSGPGFLVLHFQVMHLKSCIFPFFRFFLVLHFLVLYFQSTPQLDHPAVIDHILVDMRVFDTPPAFDAVVNFELAD